MLPTNVSFLILTIGCIIVLITIKAVISVSLIVGNLIDVVAIILSFILCLVLGRDASVTKV